MMPNDDDGGQAFPVPASTGITGDPINYEKSGMSLRDYFAAKAMAIFIQNTTLNPWTFEAYAKNAFAAADAMLAERSKP